ncbi:hypothetical protein NE237_023882 [Protea cynaroides]|uniref:Inhibitor I9 domain-containing protein n=1 Tax=Protea cynaroides TaxID=273540 RepID=A0A9Q0HCY6_9MAGN|nr:hypothetical protein NE237_023882 [Protea cynaroides]
MILYQEKQLIIMATSENHHFQVIAFFLLISFHFWNSLIFAESTTTNVYIVYMGAKKHENPAVTEKSHHDMLASLLGSIEAAKNSILYSYKHGSLGLQLLLLIPRQKQLQTFLKLSECSLIAFINCIPPEAGIL